MQPFIADYLCTDVELDGGGSLALTGPLLLCGRYDNEPSRAYEGGLAQLMVFDAALLPGQVRTLAHDSGHGTRLPAQETPTPTLPVRRFRACHGAEWHT